MAGDCGRTLQPSAPVKTQGLLPLCSLLSMTVAVQSGTRPGAAGGATTEAVLADAPFTQAHIQLDFLLASDSVDGWMPILLLLGLCVGPGALHLLTKHDVVALESAWAEQGMIHGILHWLHSIAYMTGQRQSTPTATHQP